MHSDLRRELDLLTKKGYTRSDVIREALNHWVRRSPGAATDRPSHISALAEIVARAAEAIERKTRCRFTADRYTAAEIAKAVELLLWQYSPQTKAVVPRAVAAAVRSMPADMPAELKDDYVSRLGANEAGAIIAQLENVPKPPREAERVRFFEGRRIFYPETWLGLWHIRNDLKSRRRR
jgi:hypothetical protein